MCVCVCVWVAGLMLDHHSAQCGRSAFTWIDLELVQACRTVHGLQCFVTPAHFD